MESPFRSGWSWFGFDGLPEPGIDYSWVLIQRGLVFDGQNNSLSNCDLYASSRITSKFMIRSEGIPDELWDVSDCLFTSLPIFHNAIKVSTGQRFFHLWNVSNTLIKILFQNRKMPSDVSTEYENAFVKKISIVRRDLLSPPPV